MLPPSWWRVDLGRAALPGPLPLRAEGTVVPHGPSLDVVVSILENAASSSGAYPSTEAAGVVSLAQGV